MALSASIVRARTRYPPLYKGICVCLALLLAGCAGKRPRAPDEGGSATLLGRGQASWYGGKFHGKKTANGEKFNRHAFTAAHRSLPFGTHLCVRSVANGKTVAVRVNDRGPRNQKRIIDLSEGAAARLDMVRAGVAPVELWRVASGWGCPKNLPPVRW